MPLHPLTSRWPVTVVTASDSPRRGGDEGRLARDRGYAKVTTPVVMGMAVEGHGQDRSVAFPCFFVVTELRNEKKLKWTKISLKWEKSQVSLSWSFLVFLFFWPRDLIPSSHSHFQSHAEAVLWNVCVNERHIWTWFEWLKRQWYLINDVFT